VATLSSPRERRLALFILYISVDLASREQQLYYGLVATLSSLQERRPALFILCIGVDLAGRE
jgi:hypothetical protein